VWFENPKSQVCHIENLKLHQLSFSINHRHQPHQPHCNPSRLFSTMPRKGRRGFVIDNPRLRLRRQRIRQAPAELAGLSSQAVTTHREDETLLGLDDDRDQPISCDNDDHMIAGGDSVSSVQADFGSSDASDDQGM
jgi:hypothetical protein